MRLFKRSDTSHTVTYQKVVKISLVTLTSLSLMAGCQTSRGLFGKVEDGSLNYQQAEQLEPIKLPAEQQTAPFIPLYTTPEVGVNTLELENDSGKRYQLPKPYRQVPKSSKTSAN